MKSDDNINVIVAKMNRFRRNTLAGTEQLALVYAHRLQAEVQLRAPVETGAYRESIQVRHVQTKDVVRRQGFEIDVFTDAPQARRLEYGFVGEDILGRRYDQAPEPHWRPAEDVIAPQYRDAVKKNIPGWWK